MHHSAVFTRPALIIGLCLLLLSSGCSSRFSYNFLDWWMSWQVRQHISLDRSQRRDVRDDIRQFHQWHRATQLPLYADFLTATLHQLEQGELSASLVERALQEATELAQLSLEHLIPPTAALLASLSERQAAELISNLDRSQQDWRTRSARRSPEERARDSAERWLGRITEQQQGWIEDWAASLKPVADEAERTQNRWREHLQQALAQRHDRDALHRNLRQLLMEEGTFYSETYQQALAHNRRQTLALIVRLNNHLTEQQRQHRRETFEGYAEDFRRLANTSG